MRAWLWVLLAGPFLLGACSSSSSLDESANGGSPLGGAGRGSSAVMNSGSGGYPIGISSSSTMAGGASSSARSSSNSSDSPSGGSAQGGASYSSGASSKGGASSGAASSSGSYGGKGSSAGGGGGASYSGGGSGAGASGAVPSGGNAGAGATVGTSSRATGMGGSTAMGGRTGTGTAAGGATIPPSRDAGAPDAGVIFGDAGVNKECAFSGGTVTPTLYPSGLTLKKACSPYFVSSISVNDDGLLIIEPGVTVRFANGGGLLVGLVGGGRLYATGSASDPITFTSQETQPTPGFWRGLVFGGGTIGGSKIAYAQITAAGQGRDGAILGMAELPVQVLTIDHVTIDKVGDGASGIMALGEKSSIGISNSAFVDVPSGRYPISVYAASFNSIGTGNTFPSGSAIEVMGGTIASSVTWTNPGLPVAITGDLAIEGTDNPVLTIGSGMNLKFGSNVAVQVGKSSLGKIAITGTSLARVTLTSLSSTPVSGSWAGLQIWDSGKASISYTDVRYGGTNNGDSRGNVTVETGAATVQLAIDHSSFNDSLGWGIYVPCAASVQNAAIITVDTNTTYANNVLGTKGPGLTCQN